MWTPLAPWKFMPGTAQKIATGTASAASAALGNVTTRPSKAILVCVTQDAHIRLDPGAAVAATTSDFLIKAAWPPIVIGCNPGDILSVIEDAAAGQLYLVELQH